MKNYYINENIDNYIQNFEWNDEMMNSTMVNAKNELVDKGYAYFIRTYDNNAFDYLMNFVKITKDYIDCFHDYINWYQLYINYNRISIDILNYCAKQYGKDILKFLSENINIVSNININDNYIIIINKINIKFECDVLDYFINYLMESVLNNDTSLFNNIDIKSALYIIKNRNFNIYENVLKFNYNIIDILKDDDDFPWDIISESYDDIDDIFLEKYNGYLNYELLSKNINILKYPNFLICHKDKIDWDSITNIISNDAESITKYYNTIKIIWKNINWDFVSNNINDILLNNRYIVILKIITLVQTKLNWELISKNIELRRHEDNQIRFINDFKYFIDMEQIFKNNKSLIEYKGIIFEDIDEFLKLAGRDKKLFKFRKQLGFKVNEILDMTDEYTFKYNNIEYKYDTYDIFDIAIDLCKKINCNYDFIYDNLTCHKNKLIPSLNLYFKNEKENSMYKSIHSILEKYENIDVNTRDIFLKISKIGNPAILEEFIKNFIKIQNLFISVPKISKYKTLDNKTSKFNVIDVEISLRSNSREYIKSEINKYKKELFKSMRLYILLVDNDIYKIRNSIKLSNCTILNNSILLFKYGIKNDIIEEQE